jgi:hypothetical protein
VSKLPTANSRHPNISENAIEYLRRKKFKRLATPWRHVNSATFPLQQITQ